MSLPHTDVVWSVVYDCGIPDQMASRQTVQTQIMVDVLKFQTLVTCQNGLDNIADPDQTASEEYNQHFI